MPLSFRWGQTPTKVKQGRRVCAALLLLVFSPATVYGQSVRVRRNI